MVVIFILFINFTSQQPHWCPKTDYLSAKTWEVFLCFVAILGVRVYYVDFVFFVLRHWWVLQFLTPRISPQKQWNRSFSYVYTFFCSKKFAWLLASWLKMLCIQFFPRWAILMIRKNQNQMKNKMTTATHLQRQIFYWWPAMLDQVLLLPARR